MGLQVWLSLNGNLNNQGLSDVQPSIGSNIIDSNGKIGNCVKVTSTIDTLLSASNWDYVSGNVSFGCWAKISKSELQSLVSNATFTSTNTSMGGTLLGRDSYGGLGLRWMTNNIYSSGTLSSVIIYTHIRNANYNANYTSNYTIPFDTWTHIMTICDRTNSKLSLYINGELFSSTNLTVTGSFSTGNFLICQRSWDDGNGISSTGCWRLNDIRVYNHCLSPLEVKQISKALCCHYKLSGAGGENLLSEHVVCGFNAPTSTSGGGRTSYYGSYGIGILAAENADTYFSLYTNKQLAQGKVYTLSCIVSGLLNGTSYSFPLFAQGNGNMGNLVLNHNGLCSVTFTMNFTGSIPTSTDKYGNTIYRIFMDDNSRTIASGQTQFYTTNFKLEEGSVVTPWCPNPSDTLYSTLGFNDGIEYDCSGYENNGTKVGTIAWSGDSARYSGSYGFDGNTNAIKTNFYDYTLDGIFTINMWFRKNAGEWSNKSYETLFGGQSGFEIESKNSSTNSPVIYAYSWGKGTFAYELDKWNMLTVVRTTSDTKWYLNGELKLTGTAGAIPSGNYYIGAWRTSAEQNYKGNISDFRIYATALSVEDIKALYNVSASIDKTGVLTAYEIIEN